VEGFTRDLLVAAIVGVALLFAAVWFDQQIATRQELLAARQAERAEVLENVRFVRTAAAEPGSARPFQKILLRNADLPGLRLGCEPDAAPELCANFRGAQLEFVDLSQADLSGAILAGSDLTGADLAQAELARANLEDVWSRAVQMYLANLREANLEGADLGMRWLNLREYWGSSTEDRTQAWSAYPLGNLRKKVGDGVYVLDLQGALEGDQNSDFYAGSSLIGADLTKAHLRRADLSGAWLMAARFVGADLSGASLVSADGGLPDMDEVGASWPAGLPTVAADFTGADLRGADLRGADLTGICHGRVTRWPEGFSPPPSVCVHRQIARVP
jgi:uncharacterized protein YjbI with pentapeptide repeats